MCKEKYNENKTWKYVCVCVIAIAVIIAIIAAALISVLHWKHIGHDGVWRLAIVALSVVIVSCTSLVCITVITVKTMEIRGNDGIRDKNKELLDRLVTAVTHPNEEKKDHIYKISGEVTIKHRR